MPLPTNEHAIMLAHRGLSTNTLAHQQIISAHAQHVIRIQCLGRQFNARRLTSSCRCSVPQQQTSRTSHDTSSTAPRTKPEKTFIFRHFSLKHGGPCAMKMGTDAMLLGAWAQPPPHARTVLDVGTGSGVLALMMAQKVHHLPHKRQQLQSATASPPATPPAAAPAGAAVVHAIDIDAASVTQAASNAAGSPWAPSISVHHCSLQDWVDRCNNKGNNSQNNMPLQDSTSSSAAIITAGSQAGDSNSACYDVIISNPPYFLRSSKPDQAHRAAARHADVTLPFAELAVCAQQLLAPGGRLCVVLPVQEAQLFAAEAAAAGLQLTRLTEVYMKSSDRQPKRHLMQFEHQQPTITARITADAGTTATPQAAKAAAAAAAAQAAMEASASVHCERLTVMVPNPAAAVTRGDRGSDSGSDSVGGGGSSSSDADGSSNQQPQVATPPGTAAAPWVFSEQYRQLTVDFHHPDLIGP